VTAPLNVLVIDDDADMLMLLTALLEHLDTTTRWSASSPS
jgi:CheY-like chemotaxis protein